MCGITEFFFLKNNKSYSLSSIKEMTTSLVHRGPDSFGYWSSKDNNIFLGIEDYLYLIYQRMVTNQ